MYGCYTNWIHVFLDTAKYGPSHLLQTGLVGTKELAKSYEEYLECLFFIPLTEKEATGWELYKHDQYKKNHT